MKNDNNKRHAYMLTLEDYERIYKLAKQHGKKPGDSMYEEFLQIAKEKGSTIKSLGDITDTDLFRANLREHGIGVGKKKLNMLDLRTSLESTSPLKPLSPEEYKRILNLIIIKHINKGLKIKYVDSRMDTEKGVVTRLTLGLPNIEEKVFHCKNVIGGGSLYHVILQYLE